MCFPSRQESNNIETKISSNLVTFENPVLINDKYALQGFINYGSNRSVIRKSAADFCQLPVQKSNIELVGFGPDEVGTKIIGMSIARLVIDETEVESLLMFHC
jgi:hypothetical protein